MSQAAQSNEPTMEEILASIRRIISEEGGDEAKAAEPAKPNGQSEIDDIFELTEVAEEPAAPAPQPEPPAPEPRRAVFDPTDDFEVVEPAPRASPAPAVEFEPAPEPERPTLLSQPAIERASAAFGQLERRLQVAYAPGVTIEGLVQDMLKPLLKDWLDQHLPSIVETVVREEVERVARSRR